MATAVAFGFVFGVWSLWAAQSWYQAYSLPARRLRLLREAILRSARERRVQLLPESNHASGRAVDHRVDALTYAYRSGQVRLP